MWNKLQESIKLQKNDYDITVDNEIKLLRSIEKFVCRLYENNLQEGWEFLSQTQLFN